MPAPATIETGEVVAARVSSGRRNFGLDAMRALAISLVLTRFLKTFLFGITSTDTLTFLSVALLLCLVALAACYIPARRAMNVDPVIALRHE